MYSRGLSEQMRTHERPLVRFKYFSARARSAAVHGPFTSAYLAFGRAEVQKCIGQLFSYPNGKYSYFTFFPSYRFPSIHFHRLPPESRGILLAPSFRQQSGCLPGFRIVTMSTYRDKTAYPSPLGRNDNFNEAMRLVLKSSSR